MDARGLGVPQLDAVLGPVPRGRSVLFVNDPGVEADPFLYQAADHALRAGRPVLFVVASRAPSSVTNAMGEFGFELGERADLVHFLDAFSPSMGQSEGAAYEVSGPADVAGLAAALERAADERPDAVVLLDSLSTLLDVAPEAFEKEAPRVVAALKRFPLSAALFTRWPYADGEPSALDLFDARVALRAVEERVVVSQYFSVERVAWGPAPEARPRLYRTAKPGGVFVYIPKVVVTGPFNAGKSTFVHALADAAVSVDRLGTTVALDHGHVALDGLQVDVFGTPGQTRFDPILRTVSAQALGVIVVVDATKPDSFARAKEMMGATWRSGLPAVVAANKQDLPNALPVEEVARLLEPPAGVKVVPCVGSDRESSRRVLRALVARILEDGA